MGAIRCLGTGESRPAEELVTIKEKEAHHRGEVTHGTHLVSTLSADTYVEPSVEATASNLKFL